MFHQPAEGLGPCRFHTSLADAPFLQSTVADDRGNPPIPRWDESLLAESWWHMLGGVEGGTGVSLRRLPRYYSTSSLLRYTSLHYRDSTKTRVNSQILPIFKRSRQNLALKRHWNVRGVLFGGCCILTTRASCHDRRVGWSGQ